MNEAMSLGLVTRLRCECEGNATVASDAPHATQQAVTAFYDFGFINELGFIDNAQASAEVGLASRAEGQHIVHNSL